jgi:hypothetical protein
MPSVAAGTISPEEVSSDRAHPEKLSYESLTAVPCSKTTQRVFIELPTILDPPMILLRLSSIG